jgi:two-component system sensor histidine kinase RpfC
MTIGSLTKRAASAMARTFGVAQAKERDPDLEQAILRVIISALVFLYALIVVRVEGKLSYGLEVALIASALNCAVGAWMVRETRGKRERHSSLRYIGIFSDLTTVTVGMAGGDEAGVPLIGIYLWVTVGNGFRFGARYLLVAYWLSLVGFCALLVFVPFWQTHRPIGIGFLAVLAVVPLYVLVLLSRLTAQKDAAEQLSNAKSRFVANVSHELRTPLTGVSAVYDLLRARHMAAEDRELVGMLGNAVTTLRASVDAVLQMSKLEAGAESTEPRPFNLWFFLQQIAALTRPQAVAKNLTWHLELQPDIPSAVIGDPNHLSHVLGNLINNAIKFTSSGSVTLRVGRTDATRIRFEVRDTGIGIPLDQQERLFERFVQVDTSGTRRYGGTGLGTSIAHDLVKLMGGTIGVVSSPGKGSTFWIELPLVSVDTIDSSLMLSRPKTVLVVGRMGTERSDVERKLVECGASVSSYDIAIGNLPTPGHAPWLAGFLVMPASEAATYLERVLHDRPTGRIPWIVVASSFSATQFAALQRMGAAGLLSTGASVESIRTALAGLQNRLHLPDEEAGDSTQTGDASAPLRILLADDNKSNQMLMSRILEGAGHVVLTAANGGDAFDVMASGGIDLAILDLNMPEISGPDVIKLYRAGSIGGAKLPIMILSADATPTAKRESMDAGADEFVTKPVTAASLVAAINRVMAGAVSRSSSAATAGTGTRESVVRLPSSPHPALVDPERVQSLFRIGRGEQSFVDQYMSAAFDELEKAIEALRSGICTGDRIVARDALHIIEGTGASIGAVALVASAKKIHNELTTLTQSDRPTAMAEIATTYALTKSTLVSNLHQPRLDVSHSSQPRR